MTTPTASTAASARTLKVRQAIVISLLFGGYASLYFCRADLSVAAPLLARELVGRGFSYDDALVRIGAIASLGILAYALGKPFVGGLGDYWGGRINFLVGLAGATLFTLLFAFSGALPLFTIAWFLNRLTQSGAWAGLLKVSSRWFDYSSHGAIIGLLSLSYLLGDALARAWMGRLIAHGYGWRSLFVLAAAVSGAMLIANFALLRESRVAAGYGDTIANPLNVFARSKAPPATVRERLGPLVKSPRATARDDICVQAGWLRSLVTDGLAFLADVPVEPGTLLATMPLVGQVAETNYGLLFDVRAVPEPENLAYSERGLGLHTDNPYREPVPGFQALHVLVAAPDGGESLFADGFALAEQLRQEDPTAFEVLARTPVPFAYRSRNAALSAERPLIQLSCRGEVVAVHYNNRSIQPLPFAAEAAESYYRAYRRFATLLREPRFMLRLMMRGGDLVVFDNQRILHGRTGFASARYPRHLQGCYLTRDSVFSRAALLAEAAAG